MSPIPPIGHPRGDHFRGRVRQRFHEIVEDVHETTRMVKKILDPNAIEAEIEENQPPPQLRSSGPEN